MVQVNIVGTANILELARIHDGARVIYCSSTSVYGDSKSPPPVPEDVPLFPNSVYGASKAAGEQLLSSYVSQFGLDGAESQIVVGLRPPPDDQLCSAHDDPEYFVREAQLVSPVDEGFIDNSSMWMMRQPRSLPHSISRSSRDEPIR